MQHIPNIDQTYSSIRYDRENQPRDPSNRFLEESKYFNNLSPLQQVDLCDTFNSAQPVNVNRSSIEHQSPTDLARHNLSQLNDYMLSSKDANRLNLKDLVAAKDAASCKDTQERHYDANRDSLHGQFIDFAREAEQQNQQQEYAAIRKNDNHNKHTATTSENLSPLLSLSHQTSKSENEHPEKVVLPPLETLSFVCSAVLQEDPSKVIFDQRIESMRAMSRHIPFNLLVSRHHNKELVEAPAISEGTLLENKPEQQFGNNNPRKSVVPFLYSMIYEPIALEPNMISQHVTQQPKPCLETVRNAHGFADQTLPLTESIRSSAKHTCRICSKIFTKPSSLRIHSYSHTGVRPFICKAKGCGRAFSVPSNMRRHMRIHDPDAIADTRHPVMRHKKNITLGAIR